MLTTNILAGGMAVALAYLLGSVNFALVVSKGIYRKDVRQLGSGNAGMTNMARNFGKTAAVLTLVGDMGKGVLAVWMGRWLFLFLALGTDPLYGAYLGGISVIAGHMFPLFFGFKGGKGVATSGGVILAIQPFIGIALISLFVIIMLISKMVSLGAVLGMAFYPVLTLLNGLFFTHKAIVFTTVCSAVITGLVVWMHRENIARIRAGTERKIGAKNKSAAPLPDDDEE